MKPLYDELSLPISITITDREHIFRWARTHRSHERFTRPKWDPSERYPSSADCTTATNDGLPERARIKPCRYWLSDFLVRRVLAHVRITANLVHQIQAATASPSTFAVHLEEYLRPLVCSEFPGGTSCRMSYARRRWRLAWILWRSTVSPPTTVQLRGPR